MKVFLFNNFVKLFLKVIDLNFLVLVVSLVNIFLIECDSLFMVFVIKDNLVVKGL